MSKKVVTFIATRYKDKPAQVSFYTKDGGKVKFTATEKVPVKTRITLKTQKA